MKESLCRMCLTEHRHPPEPAIVIQKLRGGSVLPLCVDHWAIDEQYSGLRGIIAPADGGGFLRRRGWKRNRVPKFEGRHE